MNSVITPIKARIEHYAYYAGVKEEAEIKYIMKQCDKMMDNITHYQLLYLKRLLESCQLSIGKKEASITALLKNDINELKQMEEKLFSIDKNKGRNFVDVMKQDSNQIEGEGNNFSNQKILVKTSHPSSHHSNADANYFQQ